MSHATDDAPAATAKSNEQKKEASTAIEGADHGSLIGKSVTINRTRTELFAYWRDFTRLPSFMENVERVDVLAAGRSHWVVKAPAGKTVEWDAVITEEIDGELIAWASVEGADVPNSGRIEFRDAGERGEAEGIVRPVDAVGPVIGIAGAIVEVRRDDHEEIEAGGLDEDRRSVRETIDLGVGAAVFEPVIQRENIIDGSDGDGVDAFGADVVGFGDETRQVFGVTGRRIGAGHGKQRNFAAGEIIFRLDRFRAIRAHTGEGYIGNAVAGFQGHVLSLRGFMVPVMI